jgi:adapter protein MecA 1/2
MIFLDMKIEKLNENKVRITLNLEDLRDRNIDYQSFMARPIETQDIFFDMLDIAEQEVGFQINDSRFAIEVIALKDGRFIFTITKYEENGKALPNNEKTVSLQSRTRKAPVHIKRKSTSINATKTIYSFDSSEDMCSFSLLLCKSKSAQDIRKFVKKCSVIQYNSRYYLVLTGINKDSSAFSFFTSVISEFASMTEHPELFEAKLTEYGNCIISGTNEVFEFFASLNV